MNSSALNLFRCGHLQEIVVFFFCDLVNSNVRLMHSHSHFHQVQLQLYFASDLCEWCNFCIYTCKGEHIPDQKWQENAIPQLQPYFDDFMLPEILPWKYKPNYYL